MDDELLTIPEAAAALKVSPVTIARWLKQGRLPAYRMGPRAVRIRREDLAVVLRPSDHAADAPMADGLAAGEDGDGHGARVAWAAGAWDTDDRLAVLREAEELRDRILTRRKGDLLPAIEFERAGKDKRGKRS